MTGTKHRWTIPRVCVMIFWLTTPSHLDAAGGTAIVALVCRAFGIITDSLHPIARKPASREFVDRSIHQAASRA